MRDVDGQLFTASVFYRMWVEEMRGLVMPEENADWIAIPNTKVGTECLTYTKHSRLEGKPCHG